MGGGARVSVRAQGHAHTIYICIYITENHEFTPIYFYLNTPRLTLVFSRSAFATPGTDNEKKNRYSTSLIHSCTSSNFCTVPAPLLCHTQALPWTSLSLALALYPRSCPRNDDALLTPSGSTPVVGRSLWGLNTDCISCGSSHPA